MRRTLQKLLIGATLITTTSCGYIDNNIRKAHSNFYTSAQLGKEDFKNFLKEKEIDVVISHKTQGSKTNLLEKKICNDLGLKFYNLKLSKNHLPTKTELNKIIYVFKKCNDKNIYVHCLYGNNRSRFCAALYTLFKNQDVKKAKQQLNWWDRFTDSIQSKFIELYQKNGREKGLTLEEWIQKDYRATKYSQDNLHLTNSR